MEKIDTEASSQCLGREAVRGVLNEFLLSVGPTHD